MRLGMIVETNDPETVWNAFRLANSALEAGHTVETFLLGEGVEAPDLKRYENINPHGVIQKYVNEGGDLKACGTCLDSRDIDADDLRPRGTMDDCLRIVEWADKVLTIG